MTVILFPAEAEKNKHFPGNSRAAGSVYLGADMANEALLLAESLRVRSRSVQGAASGHQMQLRPPTAPGDLPAAVSGSPGFDVVSRS
jgi:hypothetical protein